MSRFHGLGRGNSSIIPEPTTSFFPFQNETTVATGGGLRVDIALTEPVLYLRGCEQRDPHTKQSAVVRGSVHLKVTKCVKIKKILIFFRGYVQTEWPQGIPTKKKTFREEKDIISHNMVLFSNEKSSSKRNDEDTRNSSHSKLSSSWSRSPAYTLTPPIGKGAHHLSTPIPPSRLDNFSEGKSSVSSQAQPQYNHCTFPVGDYVYTFEFPVDSCVPGTIKTDLGSVRYDLQTTVQRSGAFQPDLHGNLEILAIQTPAEGSMEHVDPIVISRNWEDKLHYDAIISRKSFPLGSQIPIAIKLTPLAKVECHQIKVYVTENCQYWADNNRQHRLQPEKKVLLFEKCAESASKSTYPGGSIRITAGGGIGWDHRTSAARGEEIVDPSRRNLLGNISSDQDAGPTEMEFSVQLPKCSEMKRRSNSERLYLDINHDNMQINHWIKITISISKSNDGDPSNRSFSEISIDSPIQILSCMATQANIYPPPYLGTGFHQQLPTCGPKELGCGCPGAGAQSGHDQEDASFTSAEQPLTQACTRPLDFGYLSQSHIDLEPSQQHFTRPMHLLRAPSYGPPAFEDVSQPPPIVTPPPGYTPSVGSNDRDAVLDDYFLRLSSYQGHGCDCFRNQR